MTTSYFTAVSGAAAIAAPSLSSQPVAARPKSAPHVRLSHEWIAHYLPLIGGAALSVYVVLLKHLGANKCAWPSHETLALQTGLSVSGVKRCLKKLAQHGLLTWHNRTQTTKRGKQRQTSNAYFLGQNDLPSPVNLNPHPRSKRTTNKQKREIPKKTTTAPRAVFALPPEKSVVVPSIASDVSPIQEQLRAHGMSGRAAQCLVETDALECEFQLKRLSREDQTPRNAAAWLVRAIESRYRDSDAYRRPEKRREARPVVKIEPQEWPQRTSGTTEGLSSASDGLKGWLNLIKPQNVEDVPAPEAPLEEKPAPQERAQLETNRRAKERFLMLDPRLQRELLEQAKSTTPQFLWDRLDVPESLASLTLWTLVQ